MQIRHSGVMGQPLDHTISARLQGLEAHLQKAPVRKVNWRFQMMKLLVFVGPPEGLRQRQGQIFHEWLI